MSDNDVIVRIRGDLNDINAKLMAFRGEINKVSGEAKKMASDSTSSFNKLGGGISSLISPATIIKGLIAAAGVQAIRTADQYTLLDNRLKLVTKSSEELAATQEGLYRQALKTHTPYQDTVELFSRFSKATETLGLNQEHVLRITETLNKSMKISGATQTEASAATRQLSQGLASGVLRGEEFNSIMENGTRIAQMLAEYLNTDVGGLRKMAQEGKITSEIMVRAFTASAQKIDDEFGKMEPTISQAMTDLSTVFGRLISDSNKGAEGTKSVAGEIKNLAETVDKNRSGIIELFTTILSLATKVVSAIGNIGNSLQGWAAVKRGQLGFFDFATMNAKDLNDWLQKNNTESALLEKRLGVLRSDLFTYESKPVKTRYDLDQAAKIKREINTIEESLVIAQMNAAKVPIVPPPLNIKAKPDEKAAEETKKAREAWSKTLRDLQADIDQVDADSLEKKLIDIQKKAADLNAGLPEKLPGADKKAAKDRISEWSRSEEEAAAGEQAQKDFDKWLKIEDDRDKVAKESADKAKERAEKAKALREGEINDRLYALDLAEKEGTLHRDTIEERIRLLGELQASQEEYLKSLDKGKDPASWYAQKNAIDQTRAKILELRDEARPVFSELRKYADEATDSWKNVGGAVGNTLRNMEDTLVEFVKTGKLSFSSLVDSIIADLARIAVRQSITGPLAQGLGSIFGSWLGGGSSVTTTPVSGGTFQTSQFAVNSSLALHHGGGQVGLPQYRIVLNPDLLPHRHSGGLASDERMVVNKVGERYITAEQNNWLNSIAQTMQGGGSKKPLTVNIINNNGSEISTQTKETPQGDELEIILDKAVAKGISSYGSSTNKALRQSFGAKERLVQR